MAYAIGNKAERLAIELGYASAGVGFKEGSRHGISIKHMTYSEVGPDDQGQPTIYLKVKQKYRLN